MKLRKESSRIVKPTYEGTPPPNTSYTPLSVFDKVSYDDHMAVIYAYRPPTPPNAALELGLAKALSVYREWAGRLGKNDEGDLIILLNNKGVRFVEASAECTLDQAMPFQPSASLLALHPSWKGVEELVQVQLTKFTCGSMVVGFTAHHLVADGRSTSDFLVAWGRACRGLEIDPTPSRDRGIFSPRDPPRFEFEHRGAEFTSKKIKKDYLYIDDIIMDDVVMHRVHFSYEFLAKLKAKASAMNGTNKSYSTFESLVAHLWRAITKATSLGGFETTRVKISVDGRARLNPRVPTDYFGNLVLWASPSAKAEDLLREPLPLAAKLIHDAVSRVNNNYFKSFIDFASYKAEEEALIPTTDANKSALYPNLEVASWLRFPFYDVDLGGGCPYIFMPSYLPREDLDIQGMLTCETVETARRIDSGRLAMVEDELSCRRKGVVGGGEDGGFDRHWCESGIHFFGLEVPFLSQLFSVVFLFEREEEVCGDLGAGGFGVRFTQVPFLLQLFSVVFLFEREEEVCGDLGAGQFGVRFTQMPIRIPNASNGPLVKGLWFANVIHNTYIKRATWFWNVLLRFESGSAVQFLFSSV
ncbi:hypothetical protein RHGRI_036633 [Rhododendron griersonianum]|uniref:Uncharacterized protein n=1 Tax=Rhododendron griersonianum TaxID=479676 RepID=A0AAV6HP67_9ERIC|nr:hypothetical protein RHGRI_036633 [Rhododendron griersonianum]